ncbi:MAG: DsbA family protein [Actinomycetota bacterium]
MTRPFAITYDYLCPFARNAVESVVEGLREGKDWQVRFLPFSLAQVHVAEGETPVWERPVGDPASSGVLALAWGIAVREAFPECTLDFHMGAFAARHDEGRDINDEAVLREVAASVDLEPDAVVERVATGEPMAILGREHVEAVTSWEVFGVPTFIEGEEAVFARLMERGNVGDVEQVLGLIGETRLNEFKRTRIPR